MKNILEHLYFGRIVPCDQAPTEEYWEAMHQISTLQEELNEHLDKVQREKLDCLIEKASNLEGMTELQCFQIGFQLGARLTMAALAD